MSQSDYSVRKSPLGDLGVEKANRNPVEALRYE